jgi:hypothetical protein
VKVGFPYNYVVKEEVSLLVNDNVVARFQEIQNRISEIMKDVSSQPNWSVPNFSRNGEPRFVLTRPLSIGRDEFDNISLNTRPFLTIKRFKEKKNKRKSQRKSQKSSLRKRLRLNKDNLN